MLYHAIVIAIIAGPLGLFAAMVATGCRAFGSDLARAGWIGIALMPVLVTGAWEVSLLFWLTSVFCSLLWFFLQPVVERKQHRPSIQTLMAVTFLAALAGLIIRNTGWVSRQETVATFLAASAFSVWATLAVTVALSVDRSQACSQKTRVARIGSTVLVGLAIALMLAWKDQFARNLNSFGSWPAQEASPASIFGSGDESLLDLRWFGIWVVVTVIGFACARIATRWFPVALQGQSLPSSDRRRLDRGWIDRSEELLIAVTALVGIALCWVLIRPSGLALPPDESTLMYQRMEHTASKMRSELIDVSMLDAKVEADRMQFDVQKFIPWREELIEVVELNSMRLPIAGAETDIDVDRGSLFRDLARTFAFAAECQIANRESEEAKRTLEAGLQWSVDSRRGGLMIDDLVGQACGGLFQRVIWLHRNEFSDVQCEELVGEIAAVIMGREEVAVIAQRDEAWVRSAFGWFGRLQQVASRWEVDSTAWSMNFEDARHRETASLRLTALELMLACHYREHGQYPISLEDLAWPSELSSAKQEMMRDPFLVSGEMVYENLGSTYLLYSVGPDAMDQKGINSIWVSKPTTLGDDIQLEVMYTDW